MPLVIDYNNNNTMRDASAGNGSSHGRMQLALQSAAAATHSSRLPPRAASADAVVRACQSHACSSYASWARTTWANDAARAQKYNSALLVVAVATVGPRALCQRAKVRETIRSTIPARTSGSRATPHECWRRPQGPNTSEQSQATYNEPCLLQLFPVVVVVEEVVVVIVLVIQKK